MSLKIAIAGMGTVGVGVYRLLQKNADLIAKRANMADGKGIIVTAISSRNRDKDRGIDVADHITWYDNPLDMVGDDQVDVIVETIGGEQGIAKDLVEAALAAGKPVVTANKALLSRYGADLARLSDQSGAPLCYEAAIAGGIPIVKALREGLAGNEIQSIAGILNGTCNYILSVMEDTGADFNDVLSDAQDLGYAEADPSFDVDGIDAAHKLSLLTALAFGVEPDFDAMDITGIRAITAEDIANATTLGYKIRLIGMAERISAHRGNEDNADITISQKVSPVFVPLGHELASVNGVLNAVYVTGDFVHSHFCVGPGAGQEPTASAVVADIIDLARLRNANAGQKIMHHSSVFGVPANRLEKSLKADMAAQASRFYMRIPVIDQIGVLFDVAQILKDHNISIETFIQIGRDPGKPVSIIVTTHQCDASQAMAAIKKIENLQTSIAKPCIIPIKDFIT